MIVCDYRPAIKEIQSVMPDRIRHPGAAGMAHFIAVAIILFCICSAGCGKKGLPLPPPDEIPPPVADLTAETAGNVLKLTWTLPRGRHADLLIGYKIYRSLDPVRAADCPECPVRYQLIEEAPITAFNTTGEEIEQMSVRLVMEPVETAMPEPEPDESANHTEPIPAAVEFQYKVVGYTEDSVDSPDSNVVRAPHPVLPARIPAEGLREES